MDELIKKQDAIDVMYYEQVSTNPTHFKSNEKFIEFMDDSDIASFGWWQWANGFNTALLAARIQLEKLPSAQQSNTAIPHRNYEYLSDYWCECGWHLGRKGIVNFCANCGKAVKWDEVI